MIWEDDIDPSVNKKLAPKQGRRALASSSTMPQSPDTQEISLESDINEIQAPIRMRKTGHWGDDGSKTARKNSTNLIEQERFQDSRKDDSDDDIPIIPDIDDIQEDYTQDVVKKPMVSVNKATYKELDSDLTSLQTKIVNVGNLNLACLGTHLYREEAVIENDELWTMDALFDTMLACNK